MSTLNILRGTTAIGSIKDIDDLRSMNYGDVPADHRIYSGPTIPGIPSSHSTVGKLVTLGNGSSAIKLSSDTMSDVDALRFALETARDAGLTISDQDGNPVNF